MHTLDWLTTPALREMILPGLAAGVVLSTVCALLSPFVVLKKYAFVGQGVSHCAFGGVGVAAVLGLGAGAGALEGALWYAVVAAFCLAAAIGMGLISDRKGAGPVSADTAIGVFLVAAMALGAVLLSLTIRPEAGGSGPGADSGGNTVGWESILFGQIMLIPPVDAWVTAIVGTLVLAGLWVWRRPITFWSFDEAAAPAFGLSGLRMRLMMMTLLALAVVTAMKVVGVVLPTAMLVLPGATALTLTRARRPSLRLTMILSWTTALAGLGAGFIMSLELNLPAGASIVLALTAIFAVVRLVAAAAR